jgi:hypothetical protein
MSTKYIRVFHTLRSPLRISSNERFNFNNDMNKYLNYRNKITADFNTMKNTIKYKKDIIKISEIIDDDTRKKVDLDEKKWELKKALELARKN